MHLCTRVLIVNEECAVLPTSCLMIIQVAKKTRLDLHTISYNVSLITFCRCRPFALCGSVGNPLCAIPITSILAFVIPNFTSLRHDHVFGYQQYFYETLVTGHRFLTID
jgi:hypothetical protein